MPYHPRYSYSDGDVWLQAKEGTVFRLHSIILKVASPWFRALLGMPRAPTERADDPIPLAEDSDTLAAVFDILYPRDDVKPIVADLETALNVCRVADKYDLPRVEAFVRDSVSKRAPYTVKDKLRLYALACEFDWTSVRDFAAHCAIAGNETVVWVHHTRLMESLTLDEFMRFLALQERRQRRIVKCIDEKHLQWAMAFDENDYWACPEPCATTRIPYGKLTAIVMSLEDIAQGNLHRNPTGKLLTNMLFWENFRGLLNMMRCFKCDHTFIDARRISMLMANTVERLDGPEELAHADLTKERAQVLHDLGIPGNVDAGSDPLTTQSLSSLLISREQRVRKFMSTLNAACDLHVLQEMGLYGAASDDGIYWSCRGPECGKTSLHCYEVVEAICLLQDAVRGKLARDPSGTELVDVEYWRQEGSLFNVFRCADCGDALYKSDQVSQLMASAKKELENEG